MAKKLVSELKGKELDYWVAKALGYERPSQVPDKLCGTTYFGECDGCVNDWEPSESWHQAGPIIHKNKIGWYEGERWIKNKDGVDEYKPMWCAAVEGYPNYGTSFDNEFVGETPLIAAMRAFVSSKFGECVDDSIDPL
ncbi:MAG: phage protein NinX family protein [Methylomonas sp.]